MSQESLKFMIGYQREYFEIIDEFFVGVTGKSASDFSGLDNFPKAIRKMGKSLRGNEKIATDSYKAYETVEVKLKQLYSSKGMDAFKAAKEFDACKLNLGGSTRFYGTQLNATRRSLLYSDCVLIPDPIMPWLESAREEERFRHVGPLQAAFFLLHLKDLVSTDFDLPPVFVFPSWEKSLEIGDEETRLRTLQMCADVFSCYIDSGIFDFNDVIEFAKTRSDYFLEKVDKEKLFISPGGKVGESLKEAIANYKAEMRQWRTDDWNKRLFNLSDSMIVVNAVCERIQPQFHLFENSNELRSHPFLCLDAHAHYFKIITNMSRQRLNNAGIGDNKTSGIIEALSSNKLDYFSNIQDSQLIELRKTNENISFRKELRDLVNSLPETKIKDIGYVSSEVCSHINSLVSKHEKQIQAINSKYQAKHKHSALMAVGGLAVSFMPMLTPFLGATLSFAMAIVGKYSKDKFEEVNEKNTASKSLMGVLATAKAKGR
jgi:hypothetical protein